MDKLSIIVPCYNEEESIPLFYEECTKALGTMDVDYEFIFVDDGSSDSSESVLEKLAGKDKRVTYISFTRNFGKEAAMYAGFCNADGDYVVVLDADLQHPPALLPTMYDELQSGDYDSVATRRVSRKGEPALRSWFSKRFYSIINRFSETSITEGAQDYRMMRREMADAIISLSEYNRFSKGIFEWVGFRTKWIECENTERVAGKTKWSFWKLVKYAMDGIMSFTEAPLSIASWLGVIMTFFSTLYMLFIIIKYLAVGDPVAGWPTTMCIILFIGGIQLMILGIIGRYLGKTYLETKKRPHYVVGSTNRDHVSKIR